MQRGRVGCSVGQLVVRWPAVTQAQVQISARHPGAVFPMREEAMKKMESGLGEWRRMTVLYEYECNYDVCNDKDKIYEKEWLLP